MKVVKRIISVLIILLAGGIYLQAQDNSLYRIEKLPISSKVYNDMTPVLMGDTIVFCSDRRSYGWQNDATFDGRKLYSIFSAQKIDSASYGDVEIFSKDIQSITDEGPFCFTPDGKQIYFTRSIDSGKRARKRGSINNNNGIFIADRSAGGWANIRQFEYNDPLWQTAHPCISQDGKKLFFASNTPGGQGMSDIYMCEWIDGKWSEPVNLGPEVNSPAADLYPWFSTTGELYFASDRSGGLGGLDIYTTRKNKDKWRSPVGLPAPVNSEYSDFAFVTGDELTDGYFTSDRDSNDDIYKSSTNARRMSNCDTLVYDSFCWEFTETNSVDLDSLTFEFEWDFDDGTKERGVKVVHCFEKPGTYIVKLNIIDLITGEIEENVESEIADVRRTEQAFISAADTADIDDTVEFSAYRSNLPGWDIKDRKSVV